MKDKIQHNARDINLYVQDYIHKDNDFENVMVHFRRQKVLEILRHYKAKNILEIGCGCQSIFDFYFDYEKFFVVEPAEHFCTLISKSKHYNPKITIIKDFLENQITPLQRENFDFIILSSLLHEVQNPFEFLHIVKKLCVKNTILHINVPNNKSFHLLWAYESGLVQQIGNLTSTSVKLQQHSTFDKSSLAKIVKECGFSIVRDEVSTASSLSMGGGDGVGSYFIKPFNHKKMMELMNLDILDENLLEGLNKLCKYFPDNGAEIFVNCKIAKKERK